VASNIEIKARVRGDLGRVREVAAKVATEPPSEMRQVDTFFRSPLGRLKLRELDPGKAELIYYERANETGPTRSRYFVAPVEDAASLKQVLDGSLGVRGVVRKRRELYLARDTRIHLDEVESLGQFLELEVLMTGQAEAAGLARCRELMQALGVDEADLMDRAYIDMLEERAG
jgi:predicted adenylyl cyclase CyaB